MRHLLLAPILILGACATAPLPSATPGLCNAEPVQRYLGQVAAGDMGTRIVAESGSRTLRWIPLGMMVTMDFVDSRVSVKLDGANRMTSIACG